MAFSELLAFRSHPVANLEALVGPVRELVREIEGLGGLEFQLFAYSPAHRLIEVRQKVDALVMTSDIEWNHGREADDPTHELIFFSHPERFQQSVYVRAAFLLQEDTATCPGVEVSMIVADELNADLVRVAAALADAFDAEDLMIQPLED